MTCPISVDREFSIEIRSVADLKIKNLEIVSAQAPNLLNIMMCCRRRAFFVCKHLANFGGRLSSLKLNWCPITVMEIGSLNQPLSACKVFIRLSTDVTVISAKTEKSFSRTNKAPKRRT